MKNAGKSAQTSSVQASSEPVPALPPPEELMEQYAALVWKTAAAYLKNPEDIKECVNDTFLEFYLHKDRYDPEKGSYAAFLCTIARRKAISTYRKNQKASGFSVVPGGKTGEHSGSAPVETAGTAESAGITDPADMADPSDMEETIADRLDLEAALKTLNPEEFDIIRMKYYDGMTIKEIADSLNLSYETVKKRHQRSLTKLQKALTIGLILALIAALAACAYVVLRYFGIVPGYGVNTNPELPFYAAEAVSPDTAADGDMELELVSARYLNDWLYVDVRMPAGGGDSNNPLLSLQNLQASARCGEITCGYRYDPYGADFFTTSTVDEEGRQLYKSELYMPELSELLASGDAPPVEVLFSVPDYESMDYSDEASWYETPPDKYTFSFSFTLKPLDENDLENYSYAMTEDSGLLLMPSITNGELTVDIYPLNPEEGEILPSLIYSVFLDSEDTGAITATAEDGTVLTGTCTGYNPFSQDAYFTWNFGPAAPGNYTLHVPYLLKRYPIQEKLKLPVRLEEGYRNTSALSCPAGELSIGPVEPCDSLPEDGYALNGQPLSGLLETSSCWWIPVSLEPSSPDEEFLFVPLLLGYDEEQAGPASLLPPVNMTYLESAEDNSISFLAWIEKGDGADSPAATDSLVLETGMGALQPAGNPPAAVYTRWNHSFSIPFTAEDPSEN